MGKKSRSVGYQNFAGRPSDIIILVIGRSGVGKSTFVKSFLTNAQLKAFAVARETVSPVEIQNVLPNLLNYNLKSAGAKNARRLILVDTPAFKHNCGEIFPKVSEFLTSYGAKKFLGGVIYLHDIKDTMTQVGGLRDLQGALGSEHLLDQTNINIIKAIVLGTTKWDSVPRKVALERELDIQTKFWPDTTTIFRVENPKESPAHMVNWIFREKGSSGTTDGISKKKVKREKFLARFVEAADDPKFEGKSDDIVIAVMGPTGVGKSTFINSLLSEEQTKVVVGHSLQSCTAYLVPVEVQIPLANYVLNLGETANASRLIIVDTPGFDDTFLDDSEILRRVAVWLAKSYNHDMKLGGVIYLHDISQTRMLGTTRRNLDMFNKLVGHDALKAVVLGTTKWTLVDPEVALQRQGELQNTYWKEMHDAGSRICTVQDPARSPREMIDIVLQNIGAKQSLNIQQELTEMKKFIPETEAGKTLRFTIDEVIKMQKKKTERLMGANKLDDSGKLQQEFNEGTERLKKLIKSSKELKVSFGAHIMRLFT